MKRSLFLFILLFCLSWLTPPVVAQIPQTEARQLIKQGQEYYHTD